MEYAKSNGPEIELSLPTRQEAFGALLDTEWLRERSKAERYAIKLTVERLASESGRHRNDILDHYGIDRTIYYWHIDPITVEQANGAPPEKQTRERRKHSRISDLTLVERVALYDRVEALRLDGLLVPEACERVGIDEYHYRRMDTDILALRRAAREEATSAGHKSNGHQPVIRERKKISDVELRKVVADAFIVHWKASRQRVTAAARDVGISYADFLAWKQEMEYEPIFPIKKGPNAPLERQDLMLAVPDRVRVVRAVEYLERELSQNRSEIACALGYREGTVERWADNVSVLRQEKKRRTKRSLSMVLSPEEVAELKSHISGEQIHSWLRAFGMRDMAAQLQLPGKVMGKRLEDAELVQLWRKYWSDPRHGTADEDSLVRYYEPFVASLAYVQQRKASMVNLDEYHSWGLKGMMDAVRGYNMSRETRFPTYAALRVVGEMKDGLRSLDWMSRLDRGRTRRMRLATEQHNQNGDADMELTDDELRDMLGVSPMEFRRLRDVGNTRMQSIDQIIDDSGNRPQHLADSLAHDSRRACPTDLEGVIDIFLVGLSEAERTIIRSYYLQGKTMREIGEVLELSESRVSQMHSSLLERFRDRIRTSRGDSLLTRFAMQLAEAEVQ